MPLPISTADCAASTQDDDTAQVAVIVVHGVADQQPGATAQAFIDLMVASSSAGSAAGRPRYVAGARDDFTLDVPLMSPELPFKFSAEAPAPYAQNKANDKQHGSNRGFLRSLALSWKSDFQRSPKGAEEGNLWQQLCQRVAAIFSNPATSANGQRIDRGLAYTQYLLNKAALNDSPGERYASQKTRLIRHGAGHPLKIDVFEMYWADQSRLSGQVPRIVAELFTLLFRLSRLGRDAVDEASRHARPRPPKVAEQDKPDEAAEPADAAKPAGRRWGWTALSLLQTAIDWTFTNIVAQLFAQLLLVGLFLIGAGLAGPSMEMVTRVTGIALMVLAVLGAAYFRSRSIGLMAAVIAGGIGLLTLLWPTWGFGLALLALLTTAYLAGLKAAADRFPFVLIGGRAIWCAVLVATVGRVLWMKAPELYGGTWSALVQIGLTAFEFVLYAIKGSWIAMALLVVPWAVLSMALTFTARRANDYQRSGSAGTGRLGALVSVASFLIIAMAIWAMLVSALGLALDSRCYQPSVWETDAPDARPAIGVEKKIEAAAKPAGQPAATAHCESPSRVAKAFADHRFQDSTATFAAIALLLSLIGIYLVVLIVPSLLAELQWASSRKQVQARRLGRWLTGFYRHLDDIVLAVTAAGMVVVAVIGLLFLPPTADMTRAFFKQFDIPSVVGQWSKPLLSWFFISAASVMAALSIFGGVISRVIPGLRAPLDAGLDVDNYMREFPRRAIARARIFARYVALLRKVRAGGYQRIVFVAHSQGTVISSELLRFISSATTQLDEPPDARRPQRLKALLRCPSIRLLTFGCPLRQLYAARFPTLYEWVLDTERPQNGPCADDVGVDHWVNAFGSGDYVGRWLWSQHVAHNGHFHPLYDAVVTGHPPGREEAYDLFKPMPPDAATIKSLREYETCIGFAAHTHYFDAPREGSAHSVVALLADQLIAP